MSPSRPSPKHSKLRKLMRLPESGFFLEIPEWSADFMTYGRTQSASGLIGSEVDLFGSTWSESKTHLVRTLLMKFSGPIQRSPTDFSGPAAGSNDLQNPKRSSLESVSGPVDSVWKVHSLDLLWVLSNLQQTRTDSNGSVPGTKQNDVRPFIKRRLFASPATFIH